MIKNFGINSNTIPQTVYWYIFIALILNVFFLVWDYHQHGEYCYGTLASHGEVAYNVAHYNKPIINPERLQLVQDLQVKDDRRVDFAEIDHRNFDQPTEFRNIGDTVGYGMLLGCLWKVTDSLNYLDIQILQIILFSLLMMLVYAVALMLFGNVELAFYCCAAHLLFFPLIFQNIQAHRDIWAYYGVIVLLYTVLKFMYHSGTSIQLLIGASTFSLIQFIRPSVFLALITIGCIQTLLVLFIQRDLITRLFYMFIIFAITNMLFFWMPFCIHNKMAYGRLVVAPKGQDMLEGLGEYENPWGLQYGDDWYHDYMEKKYPGLSRLEKDDKAMELFWDAVQKDPWAYVKILFKRALFVVVPNLPWAHYPYALYAGAEGFMQKLKLATTNLPLASDFITRMFYIRLLIFLGYCGIFVSLVRKEYKAFLFLVCGVILGGLGKFPSHIEYRYIVPYYWPFAWYAGYLLFYLNNRRIQSTKR